MVSTSRNSLAQETVNPSIKPEVMEFFQNEIDPNMTPEQIADAVESLRPNSQSNPIFGQIVNLQYEENSSNLTALVIKDSNVGVGNMFTLTVNPNREFDSDAVIIEIINLNDFQFRLQEAFNNQSFVNISYNNNRIDSLVVVINQTQNIGLDPSVLSGSRPATCYLNPCRK